MAVTLIRLNPLWWAHLRLLGGPRRLWLVTIAYTCALTLGLVGFRRLNASQPLPQFCDIALYFMAGIQMLLLLLGGCSAVHRAVVRDLDSKMLESHRVSPMSGSSIALGYVIGPNLHILLVYLVGVMVGVVLIRLGTRGVQEWIYGNLLTLLVAFGAWSATFLLGVGPKKPVKPLPVLFVMGFCSPAFVVVPALGLVTGAYAGYVACFLMVGGSTASPASAAVLAVVTGWMSVAWLRAGVRKYRRPDLPAFDTISAMVLLVFWLLFGAVGAVVFVHVFGASAAKELSADLWVIVFATLLASMVVSLLPVGASGQTRCRIARGGRKEGFGDRIGAVTIPLWCAVFLTAFLAVCVVMENAAMTSVSRYVAMVIAMVASLVAVEELVVLRCAQGRHLLLAVLIFVGIFWALPPICDLIYQEHFTTTGFYPDSVFSAFGGVSPVGTIYALLEDGGMNVWPGLAFQVLLACVMSFLGYRTLRRIRKRRETPIPIQS